MDKWCCPPIGSTQDQHREDNIQIEDEKARFDYLVLYHEENQRAKELQERVEKLEKELEDARQKRDPP